MTVIAVASQGQAVASVQVNSSQILAFEKEGGMVRKEVAHQAALLTAITAEHGVMSMELNAMKRWQRTYNNYLKTVEGFTEKLTAATTLYTEGVCLLRNMQDLLKAQIKNPAGALAGATNTKLIGDVAIESIMAFRTAKMTVGGGGSNKMLDGSARVALLWDLNDRLAELNVKIRKLTNYIYYTRLIDIWEQYTYGMFAFDRKQHAQNALDRWCHRAKNAQYYRDK